LFGESILSVKVLAISDVDSWQGYEPILRKHSPNVVALCGDLVQDGSTVYSGVTPQKHREGFYRFIKKAGATSRVLVIAGNHDESPAYDIERIQATSGCEEISGKKVSVSGITFMGIGYHQAHLIRELDPLISEHKGTVDLVLSHCEGRRLVKLSALSPRLIVQGHFGVGTFEVYGTPTVFTSDAKFALIDIDPHRKNSYSIHVEYLKHHHPIKTFVRHPSLTPFGNQAEHTQACFKCNLELFLASRQWSVPCPSPQHPENDGS
jgi:hypothetical protein